MTKSHLERFDAAYETLNNMGAAARSVDVTEALGFDRSSDHISMMTSPDGHPRKDGYRAIGWLMTTRYMDSQAYAKGTYMVNALCSPDGEVVSIYADKADGYALQLGASVNYGYPMAERQAPEPIGAESALVFIEQALDAISPAEQPAG